MFCKHTYAVSLGSDGLLTSTIKSKNRAQIITLTVIIMLVKL